MTATELLDGLETALAGDDYFLYVRDIQRAWDDIEAFTGDLGDQTERYGQLCEQMVNEYWI